jgi:DNA-binding HxlR family transcriptional regulator
MHKLKPLMIALIFLLGSTLPMMVAADNDGNSNNSTGTTPEVTIGFGNVTNDTLVFTMDTSVDVYYYQVTMSWDVGAVYCNIEGNGGLSEDHNLFVSVLYAGCLATGYYYGAQGEYHIPSGSNGTLTSIFYQSNSPEVCIGNATYAVLDGNDELEWRNATVDPNDCLTFTRYETDDGTDVWFVLDEDSNGEGDSEPEEEDIIDDSLYPFNENLSVLENFENLENFSILMEALNITGLLDDLSPSNTPQMGWTIFAPINEAFEAVGFEIDLFSTEEEIATLRDILLYHVSFAGPWGLALSCPYSLDWMPMANGGYDDPNDYSTWNQTVLVENDCQDILVNREATVIDADNRVYGYEYNGVDGYPFNDQLPQGWAIAEDNGMIQVVDTLLIPVQYRQPDVPFVFAPEANEEDVSETDEEEENPVENENQANETETGEVDETDPEEGNSDVVEEEMPAVWECMDGTWIDADLIDDGKFDCPDGTDEYTPFVEEVQNSEELSEEEIVEVDEDETEQDLDSTPTTLVGDDSEDSGISTTEANDGVQTETEEQASKDSYIVIGGLLSFFVLIAILLGTVAVSKKEDIMLSSVFNEGGVDINELLGLLGRSKMLKVMHVLNLHGEGIRFTELKATVDTSATTLSRRLGELEEFGLVSRTELPTVPMTVIYRLTDAGLSLMPRVEGMFEWALMNGQHDE